MLHWGHNFLAPSVWNQHFSQWTCQHWMDTRGLWYWFWKTKQVRVGKSWVEGRCSQHKIHPAIPCCTLTRIKETDKSNYVWGWSHNRTWHKIHLGSCGFTLSGICLSLAFNCFLGVTASAEWGKKTGFSWYRLLWSLKKCAMHDFSYCMRIIL